MSRRLHTASSLSVERVGLGCEILGGSDWGHVDFGEVEAAVRSAVDLGITVYDTADVYGLGHGEARLSRALGNCRFDMDIVTKYGMRWEYQGDERALTYRDSSAKWLRDALEGSLKRLRLERIPTFLLHWHDGHTPMEVVVEELATQRKAGKIGRFGLSNVAVEEMERFVKAGVEVFEYEGSLMEMGTLQRLKQSAQREHVHEIVYGALHRGLLSGRFHGGGDRGPLTPDDRRSRLPSFSPEGLEAARPVVERLRVVSAEFECDPAAVALRWVLDRGPETVLVGVRSRSQLTSALKCLTIPSIQV